MAAYTTIDDPEKYFQTVTYTGNGSTQSITLPGNSDMQPDLVWFKRRDDTDSSKLIDAVRGVTKRIISDSESAEADDDDVLTSFNSDGFSLGDDDSSNASSADHVAWCWKESATAGFDIVAYTGNGTDDTDIAHSLSAVPHLMLVKCRTHGEYWAVYHHKNTSAPETDYLLLNANNATNDAADRWSDETPTSSVFTLGDNPHVNGNTKTYINYLFSAKQGFSKFGSYTGNGNADGKFVYTGFRPAWIMFKRTDASGEHWYIHDNKRLGYNADNNPFYANDSAAEQTDDRIDILSNGFKLRTDNALGNASGSTQIYAAFAEAPFVNSEGVPCNAR